MRLVRLAVALGAFAAFAGCADFAPYATEPLAADAGVEEAGSRVAICYNGLWTSKARVLELAQQECSAGTLATPVRIDWHIQFCPLALPARATFLCTPKKDQ